MTNEVSSYYVFFVYVLITIARIKAKRLLRTPCCGEAISLSR